MLQRDNAFHHVAKITSQKIEEWCWQVLPYAPNSSDTALSKYHLIPLMQHSLDEKQSRNNDKIKKWVAA
ncbi:unnamed protein product [Caenorhabditis nigoni]